MSVLRALYLAFAIWGAVHPMLYLGSWFAIEGAAPIRLLDAWFANPAVAAVSWDLLISAIVLSVWMLAETYVRKNWFALLALPATWVIGVSCGLPLYLFLRTAAPR